MDASNLPTKSTRLNVQLEPVVVLSLLAGCQFGFPCKITLTAPPDINPREPCQTTKSHPFTGYIAVSTNDEQLPTHLVYYLIARAEENISRSVRSRIDTQLLCGCVKWGLWCLWSY